MSYGRRLRVEQIAAYASRERTSIGDHLQLMGGKCTLKSGTQLIEKTIAIIGRGGL